MNCNQQAASLNSPCTIFIIHLSDDETSHFPFICCQSHLHQFRQTRQILWGINQDRLIFSDALVHQIKCFIHVCCPVQLFESTHLMNAVKGSSPSQLPWETHKWGKSLQGPERHLVIQLFFIPSLITGGCNVGQEDLKLYYCFHLASYGQAQCFQWLFLHGALQKQPRLWKQGISIQ